jgi:hypothetical protein
MDPQTLDASGSSDDEVKKVVVFLRGRGHWISFQIAGSGDADEIEVRHIQEIIDKINKVLPKLENRDRNLAKRLAAIRTRCFSAKLARREYKLTEYFDHLEILAQLLEYL